MGGQQSPVVGLPPGFPASGLKYGTWAYFLDESVQGATDLDRSGQQRAIRLYWLHAIPLISYFCIIVLSSIFNSHHNLQSELTSKNISFGKRGWKMEIYRLLDYHCSVSVSLGRFVFWAGPLFLLISASASGAILFLKHFNSVFGGFLRQGFLWAGGGRGGRGGWRAGGGAEREGDWLFTISLPHCKLVLLVQKNGFFVQLLILGCQMVTFSFKF